MKVSFADPAICRDNRVCMRGTDIVEKLLVAEDNASSLSAKENEGKFEWANEMFEEERRNFTESGQTQKTPEKQIVSTDQIIGKEEAEPESSQLDAASVQPEKTAQQENCGLDRVFNDNGKQEENNQEHKEDHQQEQYRDTQHENVNKNLNTFADQQQKTEREELEECDSTVFEKDAQQDLEENLKDSPHGDDGRVLNKRSQQGDDEERKVNVEQKENDEKQEIVAQRDSVSSEKDVQQHKKVKMDEETASQENEMSPVEEINIQEREAKSDCPFKNSADITNNENSSSTLANAEPKDHGGKHEPNGQNTAGQEERKTEKSGPEVKKQKQNWLQEENEKQGAPPAK